MNKNTHTPIRHLLGAVSLVSLLVTQQQPQMIQAGDEAPAETVVYEANYKTVEREGQSGGRYQIIADRPATLAGCDIDFSDPDYAPFSVGALKWIWLTNFEKVSPNSNDVWGCFAIVDGVPGEAGAKVYLYRDVCKNVGDVTVSNDNRTLASQNTATFNGKNYFDCPFRFTTHWQSALGVTPPSILTLQRDFWVKGRVAALQTNTASSSNMLSHNDVKFGLSRASANQVQLGTALTDQNSGGTRLDSEQIASVGNPFVAKFELKDPMQAGQSNLRFSLRSSSASVFQPATNPNIVMLQFGTANTTLKIGNGLSGTLNQVIMDPSCCI
ncbi:MAG: hypothetical protein KIH69_011990 [Anaerolineae bacterium]|nr:hypothetical protein [Anaerolineae bacterium]